MRIRKISCHKVVVELTNNDLDQLDLDLSCKPQEDIHKFLFNIMEKVHTKTGFDPYNGGQVIVEATPSESGMVLVISKIPTKSRKMTREEFGKIKSIKVRKPSDIKPSAEKSVYVFDSYEDLENALKRMNNDTLLTMTLYRSKNRYALICDGKPDRITKDIICEYSYKWGKYNPRYCNIRESWDEMFSGIGLCDMVENIKKTL